MKFPVLFFSSLFLTLVVTPLIIWLAEKSNCIDLPGKRRLHTHPTPRWGGLAFFIGILPVFFFLDVNRQIAAYLVSSVLLVMLGAFDDWKRLTWRIKFLGMITATSIMVFYGNIAVRQLGTYGTYGIFNLGIFGVPFTFFGVIGVTNAINLIDGLNGLAGGISMVVILFMGIAAYITGNYTLAYICVSFVGALAGFLRYNFPKARIFMGDSGSLFLGFSLAVFAILLTQDQRFHVEPMFPVLCLTLPIFDTLRVMLIRVFTLKNPFRADKTHLHHLMVRKKIPAVTAVVSLWILTFIFGFLAVLMMHRASTVYLLTVLSLYTLLSIFADSLIKRR